MGDKILFDKGDVTVAPILRPCAECADESKGQPVATHVVMLDFRSFGQTVQFGEGANAEYCEKCANEIAGRLRESLPDEGAEDA